jgi:hypothetical protein
MSPRFPPSLSSFIFSLHFFFIMQLYSDQSIKLAKASALTVQLEALGKEYDALVGNMPDETSRTWKTRIFQELAPDEHMLSPKYGKLLVMTGNDYDDNKVTGRFDISASFAELAKQKPRHHLDQFWLRFEIDCGRFQLEVKVRLPPGCETPVEGSDQIYFVIGWDRYTEGTLQTYGLIPLNLRSAIRPFESDIFTYVAKKLKENQTEHKRRLDAYVGSLVSYMSGEPPPKRQRLEE